MAMSGWWYRRDLIYKEERLEYGNYSCRVVDMPRWMLVCALFALWLGGMTGVIVVRVWL